MRVSKGAVNWRELGKLGNSEGFYMYRFLQVLTVVRFIITRVQTAYNCGKFGCMGNVNSGQICNFSIDGHILHLGYLLRT